MKKTSHAAFRLFPFAFLAVCFLAAQVPIPKDPGAPPSINESWKSSEIDPLIARLEDEEREIYAHRVALAAVVGPLPGSVVADVGAGSGFMAEELAKLVGPEGRVYAVDINPHMLDRLSRRAREHGLENIQTVVCPEDSTNLPPLSVDLVFICDTYHHFEQPRRTMQSVYEALRPGGQLVVVDFKRVPGQVPDWVLDHVRAGQPEFTAEIEAAGFTLTNVHNLPGLENNYILRFRK